MSSRKHTTVIERKNTIKNEQKKRADKNDNVSIHVFSFLLQKKTPANVEKLKRKTHFCM